MIILNKLGNFGENYIQDAYREIVLGEYIYRGYHNLPILFDNKDKYLAVSTFYSTPARFAKIISKGLPITILAFLYVFVISVINFIFTDLSTDVERVFGSRGFTIIIVILLFTIFSSYYYNTLARIIVTRGDRLIMRLGRDFIDVYIKDDSIDVKSEGINKAIERFNSDNFRITRIGDSYAMERNQVSTRSSEGSQVKNLQYKYFNLLTLPGEALQIGGRRANFVEDFDGVQFLLLNIFQMSNLLQTPKNERTIFGNQIMFISKKYEKVFGLSEAKQKKIIPEQGLFYPDAQFHQNLHEQYKEWINTFQVKTIIKSLIYYIGIILGLLLIAVVLSSHLFFSVSLFEFVVELYRSSDFLLYFPMLIFLFLNLHVYVLISTWLISQAD